MSWLEMSLAWRKSRRPGIYRFIVPTRSQVVMFAGALAIHAVFNLVQWFAASL